MGLYPGITIYVIVFCLFLFKTMTSVLWGRTTVLKSATTILALSHVVVIQVTGYRVMAALAMVRICIGSCSKVKHNYDLVQKNCAKTHDSVNYIHKPFSMNINVLTAFLVGS